MEQPESVMEVEAEVNVKLNDLCDKIHKTYVSKGNDKVTRIRVKKLFKIVIKAENASVFRTSVKIGKKKVMAVIPVEDVKQRKQMLLEHFNLSKFPKRRSSMESLGSKLCKMILNELVTDAIKLEQQDVQEEKKPSGITMEELPEEMKVHIVSFFGSEFTSLNKLSRVSKEWNRLTSEELKSVRDAVARTFYRNFILNTVASFMLEGDMMNHTIDFAITDLGIQKYITNVATETFTQIANRTGM